MAIGSYRVVRNASNVTLGSVFVPAVQQTEIDFGSTPVSEAAFTITDPAVDTSCHLVGTVAYVAPTDKDLDELEMDSFDLKFAPGDGQFTLRVTCLTGYVADKFKVNYSIGGGV